MKVYVVYADHDNGGGIVGIYKDSKTAEGIAEMYQEGADVEHDQVEFYVDEYTVQ